jgi:hypothetical protein
MGCGKTNSTEHAHRVFSKSDIRVSDGTNKPLFKVPQSSAVVNDRKICNIIGKGVDGEVTAERILFRSSKEVVPENHSVLVLDVPQGAVSVACLFRGRVIGREGSPAERGYFQDFILKMEMGQPETATYEKAIAKKPLDLGRSGVCGYVEVLGGSAQEQVADTSTYKVGNKTVVMEPVERAQCIGAYQLS